MRRGKGIWKRFGPWMAAIAVVLMLLGGCSDEDSTVKPDEPVTPEPPVVIDPADGIDKAIKTEALMGHLQKLEAIGSRTAGSAGYDQAVSYVKGVLADTNLIVTEQGVTLRFYEETSEPALSQTAPAERAFTAGSDFATMTYSGSGNVTGELAFVTPVIPAGSDPNSSDDGCDAEDFANVDLNGKIAVLQRGGCSYATKALMAQEQGAVAVVIFNEGQAGRTETLTATLGEDSGVTIPVLGIGYGLGEELYNLAQASAVSVNLGVNGVDENRTSMNLIAETPGGSGEKVILAGANLDTVSAGPGINGNGSGASALLEAAYQVGTLDYTPVNKIRFAWWTANEGGMVGSDYYAYNLSSDEVSFIAMYLNADSLGSSNYVYGVLDGDISDTWETSDPTLDPDAMPSGSSDIEAAFVSYFTSLEISAEAMPLMGSPDYNPFIDLGIPVGGLFGGNMGMKTEAQAQTFGGTAGEAYDPCYHMACDNTGNINQDALTTNAKAMTHVIQTFADSGSLFDGESSTRRTVVRKGGALGAPAIGSYDRFHGNRHLRSAE